MISTVLLPVLIRVQIQLPMACRQNRLEHTSFSITLLLLQSNATRVGTASGITSYVLVWGSNSCQLFHMLNFNFIT